MRPIAINQRALRTAKEELDSAREALQSALGDVQHPPDDFPWRDLMVEGVHSLIADSEQIAKRCRARPGGPAMSRILVDTIETQQDKLQFGDPIGCDYHWLEPDTIDAYGDSVRRWPPRSSSPSTPSTAPPPSPRTSSPARRPTCCATARAGVWRSRRSCATTCAGSVGPSTPTPT